MRSCEFSRHGQPGVKHSAGFTLIALLIAMAVLGITSAASLQLGALLQRRAAEDELLRIGGELRDALISYANATPMGQPRSPRNIDDLLKDPRYPNPRRHLRKHYADPLSGAQVWGIVPTAGAPGIAGFYSLAPGQPIKETGFDTGMEFFAHSISYGEWIFTNQAWHSGLTATPNPFRPDLPAASQIDAASDPAARQRQR